MDAHTHAHTHTRKHACTQASTYTHTNRNMSESDVHVRSEHTGDSVAHVSTYVIANYYMASSTIQRTLFTET